MTRRRPPAYTTRSIAGGLALLAAVSSLRAEVKPTPDVDAAIDKALTFLARQQQKDGSIHDGPNKTAMTGLAVLAYLAAGHTPDNGKHGLVVRQAVDFLVSAVPKDGYIGSTDGSRMYGQGIVALALAEAYGVEPDEQRRVKLRAALERLLKVILDAQKIPKDSAHAGGWRYEPGSGDSDLSLSGWCALALRASQNIGMNVSREPVDQAVAYVARCVRQNDGAFSYQPGQEAKVAMTSVAIVNLCLLDAADRPEVEKAARWLANHPVKINTDFPHYAAYYSMQAANQIGGDLAEQVWKNSKSLLLPRQNSEDGGFAPSPNGQEPGRVYSTAMSVLTLAVPYQMLPIYQR